MNNAPTIIATDLEGVLIPEVWINVAEKTGIEKLKLTTRDITDYDELMNYRLKILQKEKLTLSDIQKVIASMDPYDGAIEYLNEINKKYQLIVLSDTFYDFAEPFMKKLGYPTLFCHTLETENSGIISGYQLRVKDGKKKAVASFKDLGFKTMAIGDSYNDTAMLLEADQGLLFKAPDNVKKEFPMLPTAELYKEALKQIELFSKTTP